MPNPVSPSEQMLYCTIPLKLIENNRAVSEATAFFYKYKTVTGKFVSILVTNRHFVENVDSIDKLDFSLSVKEIEFNVNVHFVDNTNNSSTHKTDWFLHPTEDLAFCFWEPIKTVIESQEGKQMFLIHLTDDLLPTQKQLDDLSALEDVVMIGYPSGLYDKVNNLPLLRTGSTSSHPAFDFNGRKHGLVDMTCIPGSSGSPIFILNEGMHTTKSGAAIVGDRAYFLGVENRSPVSYSPIINKVITGNKVSMQKSTTQFTSSFMNLGYYIKSSELAVFKLIIQQNIPPSETII